MPATDLDMPGFFTVSSNSVYTKGFPWVSHLTEGFGLVYYCQREKRSLYYATGDMVGALERNKGSKWPDVLGCGAFPFLIVSERVIECWDKENVGMPPINELRIAVPFPKRLADSTPPRYYWVDGQHCRGALVDFDASGFVDVRFCPECGTRSDNIPGTFKKQFASDATFSYFFRPNSWNGLNLFTTNISHTLFFCTEAIVDCARKYKLINFRFVPVEEGHGFRSQGLKYMRLRRSTR